MGSILSSSVSYIWDAWLLLAVSSAELLIEVILAPGRKFKVEEYTVIAPLTPVLFTNKTLPYTMVVLE